MKSALVVEDHAVVRDGLLLLLRQNYPDAELWGVSDLASALSRARESQPEVVILDCFLPDSTAGPSSRALLEVLPGVPIVVLTGEVDEEIRAEALEAGAGAFLSKSTTSSELLAVLTNLLDGGTWQAGQDESPSSQDFGLTPRQTEVLRGLSRGFTNKEIANNLGSAEATVRIHVSAIFRALGVSNRTEAVIKVRRS